MKSAISILRYFFEISSLTNKQPARISTVTINKRFCNISIPTNNYNIPQYFGKNLSVVMLKFEKFIPYPLVSSADVRPPLVCCHNHRVVRTHRTHIMYEEAAGETMISLVFEHV